MAVFQEKNKNKWTKDGRKWYYKCYYIDIYGEKKQKLSKMFLTKKEAQDDERRFLSEIKSLYITKKKKIILDELFSEYEEYKTSKKNKCSSNYSDILNYKNHISPILGKYDINEINLQTIRMFHYEIDKKRYKKNGEYHPLSFEFKTKIHSLLSCILDYAVSMGYIDENPAKRYGNFQHQNDEVIIEEEKILYQTPLEFERFIKVVDKFNWKVFFMFLYWTGCRKGELQALSWKDIDFEKDLIRINKTLSNKIKGGGYKITNTKNRRNRTIALLPQLKPCLLEWYNINKQYINFSNEWFVFGNTRFYANTTIDDIKAEYYNLLEKEYSDVTRLTIHQFGRHSHASLLISLGISVEHIAKRLGDTPEVIRKTYAHLFPTYNDDIIELTTNENIEKINYKMLKYIKK